MVSKLVDLFNQEHQGRIQAELIQGDWGSADTYLTAGVAGGGGIADVIEYYTGGAASWYDHHLVIDLRPYITDDVRATMPSELWQARTAPDGAVFESGTISGEPNVIYYNPALLAEAGIDPPALGSAWTWDQFLANAKKLTVDKNGKYLGEAGFDASHVVQWGFMPRLDADQIAGNLSDLEMQATGQPMIRRGSDGQWDVFFDDAALPSMRTYLGVIKEGITPALSIGLTGDSQDEAFHQGLAAMVLRGFFNVPVLHDKWSDFQFSTMPLPRDPGQNVYYMDTVGQGYSVPVTSKHPAEAAEFVFWLQTATPQAMRASTLFLGPVNPAAWDDPLLMDNPDWATYRSLSSISKLVPVENNDNEDEFITTVFNPAVLSVASGDKTLDAAIAEIKASSKTMLNK